MIYAFEEYELDTQTIELRRDGEVVHVEPQVFSVLAHLIANRDRVVSKIELLDEVWPDRFVSESALTSRLQAARKACGDTGREQRVIRTRHGRGYRFVADVVEYEGRPDTASAADRSGPGRDPAPAVTGPGAGELVGRISELDLLDRAVASAVAGQGMLVFVVGDPGMGKTTLVEAALEGVDPGSGARLLRAQCRHHWGRPEPYVSLLDGLSRFGREHGEPVIEVLERFAPMWLQQLPSLLDPSHLETIERRVLGGTRERMLREGVEVLEQLAVEAPLLLVVEDLHWADPPTVDLIEWISDRVDRSSMLVLATYRPGEDRAGHVESTVAELTLSRAATRLDLRPLDVEAVGRLMAERLEVKEVETDLVEVTAARTGGNPLFVTEQIDAWSRDGAIRRADGRAAVPAGTDRLAAAVPRGVRQLLERSLEQLDAGDRELLEAGAVVGRELPAFAVAAALDRPIPEVEDRLSSLARRGLFLSAVGDEAWSDGTVSTVFRLTHDLHHQILYERISASRRATIHQRVGERLETAWHDRTDEHVTSLLRHFEASGDVERTVRYLQRAGELALARSAHSEAIDPFRSALELLERMPASDEHLRREVALRTSLGPALVVTLGWRHPEVQANYERALELAAALDAVPERFVVRWGLAGMHELRGEYNRSEELLHDQIRDGPELGVETHELLACSTFHQGAFDRSLEHATTAIELWDPGTHSSYMARYGEHPGVSCSTWAALAAWHAGQPDRSMEMAERAVEWGGDSEYAMTTASVQLAFLHQYRDEPDRCRRWAEETIRLAGIQGFPFRAAQGEILLGWCDAAAGDCDAGIAEIAAGLARYRGTGARMDEPYYLGLLADAELRAGRVSDALGHLKEATEIIEQTTRSFFYGPELDRLTAVAVVEASGEPALDEAHRLLARAARAAESLGSVALGLRIAVTRLKLALAGGAEADHAEPGGDVESAGKDVRRFVDLYAEHPDLPDVAAARALVSSNTIQS